MSLNWYASPFGKLSKLLMITKLYFIHKYSVLYLTFKLGPEWIDFINVRKYIKGQISNFWHLKQVLKYRKWLQYIDMITSKVLKNTFTAYEFKTFEFYLTHVFYMWTEHSMFRLYMLLHTSISLNTTITVTTWSKILTKLFQIEQLSRHIVNKS